MLDWSHFQHTVLAELHHLCLVTCHELQCRSTWRNRKELDITKGSLKFLDS